MENRFLYAIGYTSDEDADCIITLESNNKHSQDEFTQIIENGIDEIINRGNLSGDSEWFLFIEPLTNYLKQHGFRDIQYQAEMIGHDHWPVRE